MRTPEAASEVEKEPQIDEEAFNFSLREGGEDSILPEPLKKDVPPEEEDEPEEEDPHIDLKALEGLDPTQEPEPEPEQEKEEEGVELPREAPVASLDFSKLRESIRKTRAVAENGEDIPKHFGEASSVPDLGDVQIRAYPDIFAHYPIGTDGFYVHVERKMPKTFQGVSILGVQRPIEESLPFTDFAGRYGMGQYALTVYGPLKNRRLGNDGRVMTKAYTKPIRTDVPDPFGDNPPNPEMATILGPDEEDNEDEDMNRAEATKLHRKPPANEAEAEIHKATLDHQERRWEMRQRMLEKKEEREKQRQEEEEEKRRSEEREQHSLLQTLMQQLFEQQKTSKGTQADTLEGLAHVVAAMKPQGPSEDEIKRLNDLLSQERESNRREMDVLKEAHQKAFEDERRRWEDRLRDIETHYRQRIDDSDRRARETVEAERKETSRRLEDLRGQYESRLADERRQHDRDLANKGETFGMQSQTLEQGYKLQMQVQMNEVARLQQENQELKQSLTEEKNRSIADRIQDFSQTAEALGFSKDEGGGPKDWKEMLGETAMGLVQQAPGLAQNIVSTLRPPQQTQQVPQLPPHQASAPAPQMPAFATEGVNMDFDTTEPPFQPGEDPLARQFMSDPQMQASQMPEGMQGQPQGGLPSQPSPEAASQMTSLANSEQLEQNPDEMISDEQILQFAGDFREAFEAGKTPEQLGEEVFQQAGGPLVMRTILASLSVERVLSVLQSSEDGDSDPLVRRDGQQYLKALWEQLHAKVAVS